MLVAASVFAAAVVFPLSATASVHLEPSSNQQAPTAAPSDLTLRWSYESLGTDGSFRIYRYQPGLGQEWVADLPVVNGPRQYSYVDQGSRLHLAVYELRFVHRDGREEKLQSAPWRPPALFPDFAFDGARAHVLARLNPETESETWELHKGWAPESELSPLWNPLPVVPPPRQTLA